MMIIIVIRETSVHSSLNSLIVNNTSPMNTLPSQHTGGTEAAVSPSATLHYRPQHTNTTTTTRKRVKGNSLCQNKKGRKTKGGDGEENRKKNETVI